jgi:hypothetical protein
LAEIPTFQETGLIDMDRDGVMSGGRTGCVCRADDAGVYREFGHLFK